MPRSIPLHGINGGVTRAGTGFVVVAGMNAWLVTCVHLVTGLRETPPKTSLFIGARVHALGTRITLPLYEQGRQRFTAVTHESTNQLYDVMALGLSSPEAAALSRFGMHDLATVTTVDAGDEVTATGFPGLADVLIAPSTLQARVDKIDGASVQLTEPGVPGYSGSALMCARGLVGMVHGDVGVEPNLTNALALSFEVLLSELFR